MNNPLKNAIESVVKWDRNNITELRDLINDVSQLLLDHGKVDDYIDMSDLPSCPIPDDVDTSYPIWSMDESGQCLVGECANEIQHIAYISLINRS